MKNNNTVGPKVRTNESARINSFSASLLFTMVALLISSGHVIADEGDYDATLSVVLPDDVNLGVTYTSLFRVQNNNYVSGASPLQITVYYSLEKEGEVIFSSSFDKSINSFSTASTGNLIFTQAGTYTLCGWSDIAQEVCKNVVAVDPNSISCDVSISIDLQSPRFVSGETLKIDNVLDFHGGQHYPFVIEYWVEDEFGNVVKNKVNTSNLNEKSYTPSLNSGSKILIAKNRLAYVACDNSNTVLSSQAIFEVYAEDFVDPEESSNNESNEVVEAEENEEYDVLDDAQEVSEETQDSEVFEDSENYENQVENEAQENHSSEIPCVLQTDAFENSTNLDNVSEDSIEVELNVSSEYEEREHDANSTINLDETIPNTSSENEESANQQDEVAEEPLHKGDVVSFYTRTKNYNASINLYASVKSVSGGVLFLEGSFGRLQFEVLPNDKSQKFSFNVNASGGQNNFTLELYESGSMVSRRNLTINLVGGPKLEIKANVSKSNNSTVQVNKTVEGKNNTVTVSVKNTSVTNASNTNQSTSSAKKLETKTISASQGRNATTWKSNQTAYHNATNKPVTLYEGIKSKSKKYGVMACAVAIGIVASAFIARRGR